MGLAPEMTTLAKMNNSGVNAECWFLDVGQGASAVLLLGQGRAIVIDAGPKASTVPLQLLKRHAIVIEALILTHNDADHDGGVARILEAFPKAVRRLFFLVDRPPAGIKTLRVSQLELANGQLSCQPERLEACALPQVLFSDPAADIELRLLYPTFLENLESQGDADQHNRTSGVLALRCGTRSIVFAGDANIHAWEAIASRMSNYLPLDCDMMTAPHHGAALCGPRPGASGSDVNGRNADAVRKVYSEIMNPGCVVISAGTSNQHGHPNPETVAVLRQLGKAVICTQITPQCSDDVESLRPGVIEPVWPSQSSPSQRLTVAGRSKDVACAGSIIAEISPNQVTLSAWPEHQLQLDKLAADGAMHPLCRALSG
jgi:competence protein ComEC